MQCSAVLQPRHVSYRTCFILVHVFNFQKTWEPHQRMTQSKSDVRHIRLWYQRPPWGEKSMMHIVVPTVCPGWRVGGTSTGASPSVSGQSGVRRGIRRRFQRHM